MTAVAAGKAGVSPRYSVIIPHFSDERRLERLLRSLPRDRPDLQVIVVDDGGPQSAEIEALRRLWPSVQWAATASRSGAGVARNIGLDLARGEFLVFADSDDEFLPGAFEVFDRSLRPGDELVYFLAEAVREVDGVPCERATGYNALVTAFARSDRMDAGRELRLQHVVPWAKVYGRAFIATSGLTHESFRHSNDVAFNVRAAVRARYLRAELVPVYRVYRRPGSMTSDRSERAFMERFMAVRSLAFLLEADGFTTAVPATGQILMSLQYGPRCTWRVVRLALRSPMVIPWVRAFDVARWWRFFRRSGHVKA